MKSIQWFICISLLLSGFKVSAQQPVKSDASKIAVSEQEKTLHSQWQGKRVAYLGDSMTDKRRVGTSCVYWEYLSELLGVEPFVYGISGNMWNGIYKQVEKLQQEHGKGVDAIFIFAGTNDYNHNTPLGNFFTETTKQTNYNGTLVTRKYRTLVMDDSTFCGRINKVMLYLKNNYPEQQIVLMTPIHRGYAKFNEKNVQPDENYSNGLGLYIDAYIDILKQAASYWAVPLIDLYSQSGLYPLADSHAIYFHNADTDRLHPNARGDYRLAKTIQYQLQALPSTFVGK
jgi:lysophospholipase L1-like esterase